MLAIAMQPAGVLFAAASLLLLLSVRFRGVMASRSWEQIVEEAMLQPPDRVGYRAQYVVENGLGYSIPPSPMPSNVPSSYPSDIPSSQPSAYPSSIPSWHPTVQPSEFPSALPSDVPSEYPTVSPTISPSSHPTTSPSAPPTDQPTIDNPEPWYFNYNEGDGAKYGPRRWDRIASSVDPDYYWKEFGPKGFGPWKGSLTKHDTSRNRCSRRGKQSPIDLGKTNFPCEEHHEVRSKRGDFTLSGQHDSGKRVEKRIEGNKLRIVYPRRPCSNMNNDECNEPDPPHADFPNGWGGFADVVHVDFKVPAEHRINGTRYDAEMQIYHIHKGRGRMPTLSVLIRASENVYNAEFQMALDAFRHEYDRDAALCSLKRRRELRIISEFRDRLMMDTATAARVVSNATTTGPAGYYRDDDGAAAASSSSWADFSTAMDDPEYADRADKIERALAANIWDPHHASLVPTIHFYRYDGSLTEPPCGEWVSWFVADVPMEISHWQLHELETILFDHVNADCKKTSVSNSRSVARPIQDAAGRRVWQCTWDDFGPDKK